MKFKLMSDILLIFQGPFALSCMKIQNKAKNFQKLRICFTLVEMLTTLSGPTIPVVLFFFLNLNSMFFFNIFNLSLEWYFD